MKNVRFVHPTTSVGGGGLLHSRYFAAQQRVFETEPKEND